MARILLRPIGDQRYGAMGTWGGSTNLLGNASDGSGYWFHEGGGAICDLAKVQESDLNGGKIIAVRAAHREEQHLLDNGWVMTDLLVGDQVLPEARVYYQDGARGFRTKRGASVFSSRTEPWDLYDINRMRLQVGAARGDDWGPNKSRTWARATQAWLEVVVATHVPKPSLSVLNTDSVNPRLSTTVQGIEDEQYVYATFQVARDSGFTSNLREYTTPINDEDSSTVALSYKGIPGTDSHANLAPGTWYYRVKVFDVIGNESDWSEIRQINVNLSPTLPVPRLDTPRSGVHRNPLAVRSASFDLQSGLPNNAATPWMPGERLVGVEWEFTASTGEIVRWANYQGTYGGNTSATVSYDPAPQNSQSAFVHGPRVSVHDEDQALRPQGTWTGRVRAVDTFGNSSNWSGGQVFTVDHRPVATNLVPNGSDFDPSVSSFRWTFSDAWSLDGQSAYRARVREGSTVLVDTGKVVSGVGGTSIDYNFGQSPRNLTFEVMLWDSDDTPSHNFASAAFRYRPAPRVTVHEPIGEITTGQPTVSWSTVFSDGTHQVSYRVIVTNTNTGKIEYDSRVVSSSATTDEVSSTMLSNMSQFEVRVYVNDSGASGQLVGWGLSLFSTNFIIPSQVSSTASSENYRELGYVDVWWSGDLDPFFQEFRIYRRRYNDDLTLADGWELAGTVTNSSARHFSDYAAGGSGEFEYSVVQVANRYGSRVEGRKQSTLSSRVYVQSEDYWIIVPGDEANSVKLHSVAGDSFTEEYESNSYNIVGGGRRVNKGGRIGLEGSLSCRIRSSTQRGAREQMNMLRMIGDVEGHVLLRDPFGNITKVALGNLSAERIAGVGNHEFADVEIPYTEVM